MIDNYLTDPAPSEQNEQLDRLNREFATAPSRRLCVMDQAARRIVGPSRPRNARRRRKWNSRLVSFGGRYHRRLRSPGGFSATIPSEYVMVGYGPGCGVCLCLAVGRNYGSVWLADFDLANDIVPEGQTSEEIMMKLAPDWDTFLRSR